MKRLFRKSLSGFLIMLIIVLVSFTGCQSISNAKDDIVILYTNDVHCGIEDSIGYAGLAAYKKSAEAKTPHVTLVDCGDAIQGEFIGTVSKGSYIVDIMNKLGYDFAILGNHEFDYGMHQISTLIDQSNAQYLACNITYNGNSKNYLSQLKPYEIVKYGDKSVAFIGVSTPESITKSTPSYFMENGEYVYSFASRDNGQQLYTCVQGYVDECRRKGADYVVVLSHLGDGEESSPFTSVELIASTTGVDVVLDAHAHSVISCQVEKNKSGEDVLLSSTGTKLSNIGQLIITANGNISTSLISSYNEKDADMVSYINNIKLNYQKDMSEVVAQSDISLSGCSEDGTRLVRNRETTIGNLCADAYRAVAKSDIAFVNGGGIRADLPKGDILYSDVLEIHPFGNTLCVARATGQEILDALELACMKTLPYISEGGNAAGESGSFLHVSGLKYTIDTSINSSVVIDENGMFKSVMGNRRVKDVFVLNDSGEYVCIDPTAEYTVASHNYLIKEGGDGMSMFNDNKLIIDEGMLDYQILLTYITDYLDGHLSDKYSYLDGRITVK